MAEPRDKSNKSDPADEGVSLPDWLQEDGVDPELAELQPEINWFRPVMMLGVIGLAIYGFFLFQEQVSYFFSDTEPVDLGEITEYPTRQIEDPNWAPDIPHNVYVRASGIPSRSATICDPPVKFFKLIGAHVYVELPMDEKNPIECRADRMASAESWADDLKFYDGSGRAVSFARSDQEYINLRGFYEENYADLFCSTLTESKKTEREKAIRSRLREEHKAEHGEYPTDARLEELAAAEPVCHHAFIIQDGVDPRSYWHYLLIYAVLAGVILWNIYAFIRWVRRVMPRKL